MNRTQVGKAPIVDGDRKHEQFLSTLMRWVASISFPTQTLAWNKSAEGTSLHWIEQVWSLYGIHWMGCLSTFCTTEVVAKGDWLTFKSNQSPKNVSLSYFGLWKSVTIIQVATYVYIISLCIRVHTTALLLGPSCGSEDTTARGLAEETTEYWRLHSQPTECWVGVKAFSCLLKESIHMPEHPLYIGIIANVIS